MSKIKAFAGLAMLSLMLIGCDGAGENTLSIAGTISKPANSRLQVTITQANSIHIVTNEELVNDLNHTGIKILVGRRGTVKVTYLYTTVASDTIGLFDVSLVLHDGYEHGISVGRRGQDLPDGCIGCTSTARFPFRGSEKNTTDELVAYIASRTPCNGCVY
ncbi:MAG: hypothetical protein ABJB66_01375 [Gemmatimonadaceae bacterium]